MKDYTSDFMKVSIPNDFKVVGEAPDFYAERANPFSQITVTIEDDREMYDALLSELKQGPDNTKQIKTKLIKSEALSAPREGWEIISENFIIDSGKTEYCWALLWLVDGDKSVEVEIGGDGSFDENREIAELMIASISVK